MKKEEAKKLFQNEKFLKELHEVDSMEMLQKLLADNGVKMSIAEMETAIKSGSNKELTEEELKNINGGSIFKWLKVAWDCFMFSPLDVY